MFTLCLNLLYLKVLLNLIILSHMNVAPTAPPVFITSFRRVHAAILFYPVQGYLVTERLWTSGHHVSSHQSSF